MTRPPEQHVAGLLCVVREIVAAHPEGLSEYELLRALASRGESAFAELDFASELGLFRAHFLLFHTLYLLRDTLWESGQGDLDISCLRVVLLPYTGRPTALPCEPDPLRSYYLDWEILERTQAGDVTQMLDDFWGRLKAHQARQQALQALGLDLDADQDTIRRRYRELALRHHPDRGGDNLVLAEINAAMAQLKLFL